MSIGYMVYTHLRCVQVQDSNLSVLRKVWKKIKKSERKNREKRKARHDLYREVLRCHKGAGDIVRLYRF